MELSSAVDTVVLLALVAAEFAFVVISERAGTAIRWTPGDFAEQLQVFTFGWLSLNLVNLVDIGLFGVCKEVDSCLHPLKSSHLDHLLLLLDFVKLRQSFFKSETRVLQRTDSHPKHEEAACKELEIQLVVRARSLTPASFSPDLFQEVIHQHDISAWPVD